MVLPALALLQLVLLVYCLLSVVTTPPEQCRNLPKPVWVVLVVLLPLAGGIAWLVAGRPSYGAGRATRNPGRPRRAAATPPDDDADFLAQLRERAEEQRRRAAEHDDQP